MAEKLELCFSQVFQSTIWKLVAVPGKPVLVLELRDEAKRELRFYAINYETNKFIWEDVHLSEPWWVSLFDADEHAIYFRKFQNTENPDDVVWMALELASGKEWPREKEIARSARNLPVEIILPSQYVEGHDYFEKVKNFLEGKLKVTAVQAMEYLELQSWIIISFYTLAGDKFENHLAVFEESGSLQLLEILGQSLSGLGLETFFVRHGRLFCIKNKRELLAYRMT